MKEITVIASTVRCGDLVVLPPIWPQGRLVIEVSRGLDNVVSVTFDGDDEPRAYYDASDTVVVRRATTYDGTARLLHS
ncbi:hypothetical protein G0D86_29680 (plasmid) [Burkholderia multivorans]|uniref:hypothetical protein n=1 Tax=Burkholderia multivorans TaxID=87883 RepID=UPI0019D2DBCF|nr:hypothetical protein [Burkholderia multivorans]QSL63960.1 hypothetical protein G0D86_29680 [Burkholderia multivorans]